MEFVKHSYDVSRWGKPSSTGSLTIHASLVGITEKVNHFVFVFSESEFGGPYTALKGILFEKSNKYYPTVIRALQTETFDPGTYLGNKSINYCDSKDLAKHFAPVLHKQLGAKHINVNMYGKEKIERKRGSKGNGFLRKFIHDDHDTTDKWSSLLHSKFDRVNK